MVLLQGRWLAAALAAAMVAAPAAAQEKPGIDWSGFYLGAGAGYAFGGANYNFLPGSGGGGPPGQWAPDANGGSLFSRGDGGLYGLHAGYLLQRDRWVGGLEASLDLSDFRATTTNGFALQPTTVHNTSLRWLATLTPRIGYAWSNFQVYGKAGVAMARTRSYLTADGNGCIGLGTGQACSFNAEETHVRFTAGAGVAYAFSLNWIFGLEYDYYDLGAESYGGQTAPNTQWNVSYTLQPRFSAVRGRVSYKFGGLQAAAADSAAVRTDAPTDPQQRWQGFYVGANAGYGWANFGHRFDPGGSGNGGSGPVLGLFAPDAAGGFFTQSGTGGVYGLHAGYNQQWDRLVGGLELTVALTDTRGQSFNPFGAQTDPNATYSTNIKWLATLAPRIGLAWEQFLLYGKAGLAVARVSSQLNSSSTAGCFAGGFGTASTCAFSEDRTHIGVVLGAGIEYQFAPNWSIGVEFNYMDLSIEAYGGTIAPNTTWPLSYTVHPQVSIVKGRVSYRL